MKTNALRLGILALAFLGFVSCKDEKQEQAEKTVNNYVVYVDSLNNIESANAKTDWTAIEAGYQDRTATAEAALADMKESDAARVKLEASKAKFEAYKIKVQAELDAENAKKMVSNNPNQMLRDRFFGEGKIGEDMNFSWVNKDNILKVYDDFFQAYKDNKKDFTREDYDEVKLLYEALDSRKNTVEKEGLSAEDNNKIGSIKFKFAPMFKMNRIGAKARETAKAKE